MAQDPVTLGLVASVARPGGNLTGINLFNTELTAKRLDLLRALMPNVTRVAVLVNSNDPTNTNPTVRDVKEAAARLGLEIEVLDANTNSEINAVFTKMENARADALFVGSSPYLNGRRVQLAQLAAFHRLPATYALRECVEVGGLMSYGADIADAYRQIGVYAGRILKGAKIADLPVVQASKLELVLNTQTARMLGISVPPSILSLANEVIE